MSYSAPPGSTVHRHHMPVLTPDCLCAVLVAIRNWPSTLVRIIIAPFIFIALIWLVNQVS